MEDRGQRRTVNISLVLTARKSSATTQSYSSTWKSTNSPRKTSLPFEKNCLTKVKYKETHGGALSCYVKFLIFSHNDDVINISQLNKANNDQIDFLYVVGLIKR